MRALDELRGRLRRWLDPPVEVGLVCEIAADYVSALRHHRGRVESWAIHPLPAGVVRPQPLGDNIVRASAVQEAVQHVIGTVADGRRQCVLLVPDLLARIVLLEFDHLPARTEETERLLRWRLKKDLPFDVQQGVLSYRVQAARENKREVIVAVCLRGLVRQYEECLEKVGLQPGWVGLSTLASLGCLEGDSGAPRLLAKRDSASLSLALIHGSALRLFRSLPTARESSEQSDKTLFEKLYPVLVYFADQCRQPVCEVVLAGPNGKQGGLTRQVEEEVGCGVRELTLEAFDVPLSPTSGSPPDYRLVPALGWARGEPA
ncbi:MAG: hypothetical protein ACE5IP_01290 [Terriglobia bacterium]